MMGCLPASAQTNSVPAEPKAGICDAALVIGCLALAGTFVIWAMNGSRRGCCVGPARLVLWSDEYNGLWIPIATNDIGQVCHTNKFDVFRERMGEEGHRYQVKVYPLR